VAVDAISLAFSGSWGIETNNFIGPPLPSGKLRRRRSRGRAANVNESGSFARSKKVSTRDRRASMTPLHRIGMGPTHAIK
jgi:hypothetical protein